MKRPNYEKQINKLITKSYGQDIPKAIGIDDRVKWTDPKLGSFALGIVILT